ncbi:MAG TPA: thermonuclease family protein [bacterium]|nr:thermonuclease family protein [bacterium]
MKRYLTATALGALAFYGALFAAEEEIAKTPAGLEFKAVTATCEEVVAPNVLRVKVLGECALIGVQPVARDDPYYREALEFVRIRAYGRDVRVEVCPNMPVNEQGQNRAVVYYYRDGKWVNLDIELISAGLAKVADVPGCHVPTKAWLEYEKAARKAKRGMWAAFAEPAGPTSDKPDISDFDR